MRPEDEQSRETVRRFNEHFEYALAHYFAAPSSHPEGSAE